MAISTLYGVDPLTLLGYGLAAWFISISFYRLYLHPLRKIPGPRLAALTWAYEIYYDVVLPGQYNFKLQELHKRYGPILRVNPGEVHIADKDFLGELYDARKRNKLPENSLDIESSVAGTAEWELHKRRRHSMTNFFSPRAVQQLEPLLLQKRAALLSAVDSHLSSPSSSPSPLNLSDLYFAYCWDILHEYAFAFPSSLLTSLPSAHALRSASNALLLQVNFTRHFHWVNSLASLLLPASLASRLIPAGVEDIKANSARVRANVDDVLRDAKTSIADIETSKQHKSIFYSLRDDPSLPRAEKEPLRLAREGNFLVVAGSDSPARAIATTHFYLLDNPDCLERLRGELKGVGREPGLAELERLPYLNACILEGNRLSFGLTRRMLRVAPEDHIVYREHVVPAGTPLAISSLAVHTDPEAFPEPWRFRPERWLGENAKELRKYMMSFGAKGPRSCLGIHLAEAELRLAIAAMAGYEMRLHGTTVRDVEDRHDFQMSFGNIDSEGVVAEVLRKKGL